MILVVYQDKIDLGLTSDCPEIALGYFLDADVHIERYNTLDN